MCFQTFSSSEEVDGADKQKKQAGNPHIELRECGNPPPTSMTSFSIAEMLHSHSSPWFPLRAAEFSDANAKFYCRIYYAEEFHKMREEIMESREEDFVRSLSHCVNWQARGGKSGAVFYATEGTSHAGARTSAPL